jgi:hypothetical protein
MTETNMTSATASPPTSSVIRPAIGLLAGMGITALVVGPGIIIATLAMLRGVDPQTFQPSTANLIVYLVINGVGAFVGGLATARITIGRSFYTVFLLALVLFTSAMVPVLRGVDPAAPRPQWFLVAQAVIVLVAALLGGYLERRREVARLN